MTHAEAATLYAKRVVAGEVPACKWVRLACQRQLDDLERWKDGGPYRFDTDAAERVCKFIELLPHTKGEWARRREKIRLEPWQQFILTTAFGWVRRDDGMRRYRTVYEEEPRKNAKSTKGAGVGLYMLAADGEAGAEVYSAATTRDQARIVFSDAQAMARKEAAFRQRFGVEVGAHAIWVHEESSKFIPLSADAQTLDGLNVHCAIIDELHAHRTREVYDVIETATGARSQSLVWNVTTAGSNRSGICYEIRTYATKVLEGIVEDETFFGIIYTIDDGDDWTTEEAWRKANPNYGVSVKPDDMARLCVKAQQMPSAQNNFLTKRLNVWVNAGAAWMDMRRWEAQADPVMRPEDFEGCRCWVGLDLAAKRDLTARVLLFEKDGHYYAFLRCWLPAETIQNSSNAQYSGWEKDKFIVETDGATVDYEEIRRDLNEIYDQFKPRAIAFDPHDATMLVGKLLEDGLPMVELRQNTVNLSEPMKEFEAQVYARRFHHDANPVFAWAVSNVVYRENAKGEVYPRKEREENKIDPVVATIIAFNRAMADRDDSASTYESSDLLVL